MLTGFSRTSCTDALKYPADPSRSDRPRACPPRTALSGRRLEHDRHLLEVKDVPVGNLGPRSAELSSEIHSGLRPGTTCTGFGSRGRRPTTPPPGTPGGPAVSMVLTSVPHRRRTPTRNLRIPTNAVGALMTGSSMSALWTLGRGILAAPPGTLPQARTPLAPCVALARGREIVVRRRLRPGPFQNRLHSTRVGIY